jgi:hypothetical protein
MITDIPQELIPVIGSFLGKEDRNACHLAAKCLRSISHNIRECGLSVDMRNFDLYISKRLQVQKTRTPNIETINVTLFHLNIWDGLPTYINEFSTAFPDAEFKVKIVNCKDYDKIITCFPEGTEVSLTDTLYSTNEVDVAHFAGKRFSYVHISDDNYKKLLANKEIIDAVANITIKWKSAIDLSNVDPTKTSVTLMYSHYSSSRDLYEFEHKDLVKAKSLWLTAWTSTSFKSLALIFARASPNFKENSHLREVDLISCVNFATENMSMFIQSLPSKCKVNVINMITGRNHHINFHNEFTPSNRTKRTYNSLQDVWDNMTHQERSLFGYIKYFLAKICSTHV